MQVAGGRSDVVLMADDAREVFDQREAVLDSHEQLCRRKQWSGTVDTLLLIAITYICPEMLGAGFYAGEAEQERIGR